MKILVLNGSPKGRYSITLQTVIYLQQKFPAHEFDILHVGQKIKAIERDFSQSRELLENADMILFAYPVYTFIAPCQLHRFIELMKDSGIDFSSKYATQITTSKHFYDVTAHNYIRDNCFDMGLKYLNGLSADMDDLLSQKGQKEAYDFFLFTLNCIDNGIFEAPTEKTEAPKHVPVTVPENTVEEKNGDTVIVADIEENDTQLVSMIERFRAVYPGKTRTVNIHEYPFKGGCISCFNCSTNGKCIYTDGFDEFLRNNIQSAQATVYAFSIKDHSMGSIFKTFDDRQFCNGHRTVTMGKPVGYIVSGNYSEENNLKMILEGRAQVGGNFLAGVATDEYDTDNAIDELSYKLNYAVKSGYTQPQNFYGVGGMKIFRDLIYLMQGMMKADHKFYKSHGQYDFPQKKVGRVAFMYLAGAMMSSPKIKAKMGNKMNEGMLMPYQKAIGVESDLMKDIKETKNKKKTKV